MSVEEFNELLPSTLVQSVECNWLPTDKWLMYHASIQGEKWISSQPQSLASPQNIVQQNYLSLQG